MITIVQNNKLTVFLLVVAMNFLQRKKGSFIHTETTIRINESAYINIFGDNNK